MINTKLTRKAMIIAYEAHKNQVDKSGVPYIYHPIHVAEQMDTENECIIALLHDVVEDTNVTFKQLEEIFSKEIIDILKLLTKKKEIDYYEYINKVKENTVARKVKIADIEHNLDRSRLDIITDKDIKREEKYKNALSMLMSK
jgi:(p)ppGpp synthase/HD superfamily hydrolase